MRKTKKTLAKEPTMKITRTNRVFGFGIGFSQSENEWMDTRKISITIHFAVWVIDIKLWTTKL